MAFKSQLRLQQITGSLVDIKSVLPTSGLTAGTAVASLSESNIPDLEAILEYYAKAIQNIHGNAEFGANTPGQFEYSSGNGILALKPSIDNRQVLGAASVSSRSSVSGLSTSNISDSTLLIESTTIGLTGAPSYSLSGNTLVFSTSGGDEIAFRVVESSSSSITVIGLPEASTVATMSVSGVSTIEQGNVLGTEWKNVRTRRVEGTSGLVLDGHSGVINIDGGSLDADFTGAGAMTFSSAFDLDASALDADFTGAIDMQAGASSEIGLADGVLTLDLNGTDVVDGLLVDAEGSITLEAAHSSDGAMILNAGGSAGVIQMQQQGAAKLLVSGSEVRVTDQFRVIDDTESSSTTTGAVQITGGIGIGKKMFLGGDLDGAGDVTLDKSNVNIRIGSGAHQLDEDSSGLLLKAVGSSKKLVAQAAEADIEVKGGASGTGGVVLSGSSGVEFVADGGFAFSGHSANGGLLLTDNAVAESVLYRSNFSSSTSIVAALNQLKSEIDSGEPTLFKSVLTADVSAGSAVTLTKIAGDISQFETTLAPNKAEVYMNGQLLVSGSESERAAGTADYAISGNNEVKFAFAAKIDDTVVVIDRS